MNSNRKVSHLFIISFITLIGFSTMALLVNGDRITEFDKTIISFVQGLENPLLTTTMKFFTFVGAGNTIKVLAFITVIFLFFFLKQRSKILLFIVVLIGSHYVFRVLKALFQRVRPDLNRLIEIGGYSFPSGHATNAMTFYGSLAFLLWSHIPTRQGRTILIVFSASMIFLIGLSRIYLGVHYPSDVIAGYFAGGFWLVLAIGIYQFVMKAIRDHG